MNTYIMEFIGAFFLVFTVGCTVVGNGARAFAPLATGTAPMVMVYAGGHVSGAHYNPAIALGVWLREKCPGKDAAPYMIAQVIGGVIAAVGGEVFEGGSDGDADEPGHVACVAGGVSVYVCAGVRGAACGDGERDVRQFVLWTGHRLYGDR
jgi:hypothetical protein